MLINPIILTIAKLESDYIEEWVKYHLNLGFKHIYLYENDDEPIYKKLLEKYLDRVTVIHFPGNNREIAVHYMMLRSFAKDYMYTNNITHIAHIDIDEFIVLKKHRNISEFIKEYIIDDCGGIAMIWRYFGSSGHTKKTNLPVTQRFTMCEKIENIYSRPSGGIFKSLFEVSSVEEWCWKSASYKCGYNHMPIFKEGKFIKTTTGEFIEPWASSDIFRPHYNSRLFFGKKPNGNGKVKNINFDIIQLNHYKCKTFEEYKYSRIKGLTDYNKSEQLSGKGPPKDGSDFGNFDHNEVEDLTAKEFYIENVLNK
jgi:hypothetical protein